MEGGEASSFLVGQVGVVQVLQEVRTALRQAGGDCRPVESFCGEFFRGEDWDAGSGHAGLGKLLVGLVRGLLVHFQDVEELKGISSVNAVSFSVLGEQLLLNLGVAISVSQGNCKGNVTKAL